MCCILFTLTQGTVIDTSKIINSALSSVVVISWCSWGWVAMSRSQANSLPSLHSRRSTQLTACAEPATMGWWRGRPGPASTPSTDGLGTSQDDKYPFSLSEERISFERFSGCIFPVIPLWPQNLHFIWWTEARKISELETRNISAGRNWKDHCRRLLYESVNKVQFNEVTEHKQHVIQPHCKAFSAFSSEISSQN